MKGITCKGLNVLNISSVGYETSTLRPLHYLENSRKDIVVTQRRISNNGNLIFYLASQEITGFF